jgi:hypothetical protein
VTAKTPPSFFKVSKNRLTPPPLRFEKTESRQGKESRLLVIQPESKQPESGLVKQESRLVKQPESQLVKQESNSHSKSQQQQSKSAQQPESRLETYLSPIKRKKSPLPEDGSLKKSKIGFYGKQTTKPKSTTKPLITKQPVPSPALKRSIEDDRVIRFNGITLFNLGNEYFKGNNLVQDDVASIEGISNNPFGEDERVVYVVLLNGRRRFMGNEVARRVVGEKLLDFYEDNLEFV